MTFWLNTLGTILVAIVLIAPMNAWLFSKLRKHITRNVGRLYLPHPVGSRVMITGLEGDDAEHLDEPGTVVATMFVTTEGDAKNECAVQYECGCVVLTRASKLTPAPQEVPA